MLPIDPIGSGAGAGLDRVSAVQRVMEAMQQPMAGGAGGDALPSTPLQQLQHAATTPTQYAQATADVFRQMADNSLQRQREAGRSLAHEQAADQAPLLQQAPVARTDAASLSLMPGRWMAALDPNAEAPKHDAEAQGDGDASASADQHDEPELTEESLAPEADQWHREVPALSFQQLCRALRAQGQTEVMERLALGRAVLAVLHTGSGCLAGLMCPNASAEPDAHGLQGELKLFRARVVNCVLPGLWRVRQQAAGRDWRLLSDAGAPALWLDGQAPADAPGLHVAHGQRMRLDVAKQWVMWVVNLKGDASQWEH